VNNDNRKEEYNRRLATWTLSSHTILQRVKNMEVTDSKSRKTTVHARGCDGMSRLFPQQVCNQQATKYELSGSRVKQCCRDAFSLPSPVEEDVMNKSLRLETKNVEALPLWERFIPILVGLGVVTAYREILGRAAAVTTVSFSILTL
jgi:hypothetical protein